MLSGVYQILNKTNNKKYIGSTTVSFNKRWKDHNKLLVINKHYNTALQNAYNKYGKDNFEYSIMQFCPKELCIDKEQWFIDKLKPEYNICKKAGNTFGYNHTEVSKMKMSEIAKKRKGRFCSLETIQNMSNSKISILYSILCPDETIVETNSLNKFAKENKLNNSCLFYTFKGVDSEGFKRNHHKGYKIINKTRLYN